MPKVFTPYTHLHIAGFVWDKFQSGDITMTAACLWGVVYTLQTGGWCTASNRYLGTAVRVSSKQIESVLKCLEHNGLIERQYKDEKRRIRVGIRTTSFSEHGSSPVSRREGVPSQAGQNKENKNITTTTDVRGRSSLLDTDMDTNEARELAKRVIGKLKVIGKWSNNAKPAKLINAISGNIEAAIDIDANWETYHVTKVSAYYQHLKHWTKPTPNYFREWEFDFEFVLWRSANTKNINGFCHKSIEMKDKTIGPLGELVDRLEAKVTTASLRQGKEFRDQKRVADKLMKIVSLSDKAFVRCWLAFLDKEYSSMADNGELSMLTLYFKPSSTSRVMQKYLGTSDASRYVMNAMHRELF